MKKTLLLATVFFSILTATSLTLPTYATVSGADKTITFNLNVPYHEQETPYFCGPATAQMWIEYDTGNLVDQWTLFYGYPNGIIYNNLEPQYWYTDPHGLAYTLSYYVNPTYPATISDYSYNDPYVAVTYQAISIVLSNQPSAALVWHGNHWMLLKGVVLQFAPKVIKGFFVHDPWYGVTSLGADAFKTSKAWVNSYFTDIRYGVIWYGKWATVEYYPQGMHPNEISYSYSITMETNIPSTRRESISSEKAVSKAIKGFEDNSLYESSSFEPWLRGAKAASPIRVQSLSEDFNDYYIVPFERCGKVVAAALVDALTGDFLEASYGSMVTPDYLAISSNQAIKIIENYTGKGLLQSPKLTWMPCSHSWQPYYPFWMGMTTDGGQVFVDMNGVPFEA